MTLRSAFLLALAWLAAGCGGSPNGPSAEPASFGSTVSFGFCLPSSYCTSRLDVTATQAVFTYESRERPPLVQRRALEPREWRRLVSALDPVRLRALPSVVGCPDCADGGAESVTVAYFTGRSTTVTFEYNHDVPGIEELVSELRAIRRTFETLPVDAERVQELQ